MSKNIIFYYSGTGNSLSVAKRIGAYLYDTELIPMIKKHEIVIDKDVESVGLVYPIYVNATPRVVLEFLKKHKEKFSGFVYSVATHGGIPGVAGLHHMNFMRKMGIQLNGYYEIKMINNTPKGVAPKPFMHLEWENEIGSALIEEMLEKSGFLAQRVSNNIANKKSHFDIDLLSLSNKIKRTLMKPVWWATEKNPLKVDFILDDTCIGCGNCVSVCPTSRIELIDNQPQWVNDQCNCCYACFNFCPSQAIGVEHYTKKMGRYHHPEIDICEIVNQK